MANSYLRRWRSYKGKSGRRGCRYGLQPQKMCLICNDDSASPNSNIAIPRRDSREPWNASTNPHSYPFLIRISMIQQHHYFEPICQTMFHLCDSSKERYDCPRKQLCLYWTCLFHVCFHCQIATYGTCKSRMLLFPIEICDSNVLHCLRE